ncbi:DUF485 domain-containing protein [Streptomyces sp. WMMB 322]|uniref:DUF485 domain-containing protein n=1 Tax=Streptomyces sp. WMMB 322 TaxID=1286821 RepID=UPI0006E19FFD|nr:DUF485 domain-containing protein [Streptomyces sp. WMMB 322]SCK10562.1 Uncharacterized membrane protein, DUF485 family [Streptomyces sp. WMMB 322]
MARSRGEQRGFFDDYGAYPPSPSHPPRPAHPPRPSYGPPPAHAPTVPARADTELRRLRGAYKWLRRSMTVAVLGYFTVYLAMTAYLPGLMTQSVFGAVNLGVLLGLLLLPITLLTVLTYELFARVTVDPMSHRVRIADEERRESEEEGG